LKLGLVGVVVGAGGEVGEGTLETPVVRAMLGGQAEMPFSGQESQVAGVFEQFGEGDDALVEVAFVAGRDC